MFDEFKSVAILLVVVAIGVSGYFAFDYVKELNQEVADTFVANALLQEQRDLSDAENDFYRFTLSEHEKNSQESKGQLESVDLQHSVLVTTIEDYDLEDNIEKWFEADKAKLDDCLRDTTNRLLNIYQKTTSGIDGSQAYEDSLPCARPTSADTETATITGVLP